MKLSLDTFLTDAPDLERREYEILGSLKRDYKDPFSHNYLYPPLSDLIALYYTLRAVLEQKDGIEKHFPRELIDLDIEHRQLIYRLLENGGKNLKQVTELMSWAIPYILSVIREGKIIYDFIAEHIHLKPVGIIPIYKDEGYWLVTEVRKEGLVLHTYRYEISAIVEEGAPLRQLKTHEITVRDNAEILMQSPEFVKHALMVRFNDLPVPATFISQADLEFPYQETILPVAKREFIGKLLKEDARPKF